MRAVLVLSRPLLRGVQYFLRPDEGFGLRPLMFLQVHSLSVNASAFPSHQKFGNHALIICEYSYPQPLSSPTPHLSGATIGAP